jgi:hypothetical protein
VNVLQLLKKVWPLAERDPESAVMVLMRTPTGWEYASAEGVIEVDGVVYIGVTYSGMGPSTVNAEARVVRAWKERG